MTDEAANASGKQAANLLQDALTHLNRDDIAAAENVLDRVLAIDPKDANALQLMGLVREAQGEVAAAEGFYRRSLTADSAQPHVHHNLGTLFYYQRRYDEAIAQCAEAIRQRPNYAEAHLRLGLAHHAKGEFEAAERAYRACLRIQPNYLVAKQSLGMALNEMERPAEAERITRQALAAGSRDRRLAAALQYNLGVSLKRQHRFEEALQYLDAVRREVPDMPLLDQHRAGALEELGRLDEAAGCYRRAVARNPLDFFAHIDLNRLLYRLGRDEEFMKSLDEVAVLYPDAGYLPLIKADFLFQLERYEEALEAYERAAPLLPDDVKPRDSMGMIYARTGRFEDAIKAHEAALELEPQNALVWANFAETLIRAGDTERALEVAERAVALAPDHQRALGMWGLALRKLGDAREEELNDYENLVQVFELSPPEGYSDMESFNRELNAYLDSLHRDRREMIEQTLRNGTQTLDALFGRGYDPVERLRARIDEAVLAYIAAMKDDETHPLFRRRTGRMRYSGSWSSRLYDCGFHTNHVHAGGWISSCYYVALPDAVADEENKQGWLKFGEPAFDASFAEPVRRAVQPQPGMLVLFPSYMWHGTVPFRSQQSRTTIAFDVVPG